MITRIRGTLESLTANAAVVAFDGGALAREVLLPAYLASTLSSQLGQTITLATLEYLEGQGQGTSFIPRLVGFRTPGERRFFEVFTTVKGLGAKRALRALEAEPVAVIEAIMRKDAKALQELPEIGKRLSDTIVAELSGKVEALLADLGWTPGAEPKPRAAPTTSAAEDAVLALVALGQTRAEAERGVAAALASVGEDADTQTLVAAAFGGGEAKAERRGRRESRGTQR
jgi:Holliday junction DNA helicase RuvA